MHKTIKSRLKEFHLLGISHNDIRPANIHVSESGKTSLIDFGLSDCMNDEKHKMNDFESLEHIVGIHGYGYNNEALSRATMMGKIVEVHFL